MRNRQRTRALTLAALLVPLVGACSTTVKQQATTPTSTRVSHQTTTTIATQSTPQAQWHACDNAPRPFVCATIKVPIDYTHPKGKTLDLALVKLPAGDQANKIGPLLVNPGGPGGSGIDFVEQNFWSPALTHNFDIIGFDPRGVGQSTPLHCGDLIEKMYSSNPAPRTPQAINALKTISQQYVAGCKKNGGDLLKHMGTRDVARDLDQIRAALGVSKISYLGYSYGTSIGQVYADLFPKHIRAMVLDGVVKLGQSGIDAAIDQGVAFDKVLDKFYAECAANSWCTLGASAPQAFNAIRTSLLSAPMPTHDNGRTLTIGEFHLGVGQALYTKSLWTKLAAGLDQASKGDGSLLLDLADEYLGRNSDGTYSNQTDVYFATSCLDWDWSSNPDSYLAAGRKIAATSPNLAEGIVTDYIRCAYWPTPPQPLTPPKAIGSPQIVVISTTNDPATPYVNGVELAKLLPHGTLITRQGDQHTAYGQGDSCVDNPVNAYLVSLAPPTPNLVCK